MFLRNSGAGLVNAHLNQPSFQENLPQMNLTVAFLLLKNQNR